MLGNFQYAIFILDISLSLNKIKEHQLLSQESWNIRTLILQAYKHRLLLSQREIRIKTFPPKKGGREGKNEMKSALYVII